MGIRDLLLPQAIFLNAGNLRSMATDCAPTIVAAVGMTFVILTGGIDLSVGSIIGVSAAAASLATNHFQSVAVGIAFGVAAGALCGVVNGMMVVGLRVQPFIVTLGTLMSMRGLCHLLNSNATIFIGDGVIEKKGALALNARMGWLSKSDPWSGVPRFVPIVLAAILIARAMLKHTRLGRRLYAVGSNEEAARLSGVRVASVKLIAYGIGGFMAGIAGVMYACRMGGSGSYTGSGEELTVIAAVVIGGTSLLGGQGTVTGCVIGAVLMRSISYTCTSLRIPDAYQLVISGMFLVAAAALDRLRREKAG
ncbi:MAG TPA: ABC transporter permease [Planctomycetota bacterium]|nr:ABC transporter permease [Planctomycetota bacterium]